MSALVESEMSKEETVAHVCISPGLGGLELYSIQLHQMFLRDGYAGLHFCMIGSPLEEKLKELGLQFVPMKKPGYLSPSSILKFRSWVKKKEIKKIYVHHLKDLWFIVPALIGLKDVELVGIAQMFLRGVNKKDFLHRMLYGRLKKLIALTEGQKKSLQDCLPLSEDKYVVIPNSISMDKFKKMDVSARERIRKEIGIGNQDKLIGIVGRIDPWKGQLELLQAFCEVHSKVSGKVHLLIVGSETPGEEGYKQQLLDFVKSNKIDEWVHFVPFQPNVPEWMSAFDIFVMPSYEEAFGIVLVEAMASGLPCISTNAGGVPDIITNENLGVLVPPRESQAISEAIYKLLSNFDEAKEIGKRAQKYAYDRYDLENVYQQVKSQMSF